MAKNSLIQFHDDELRPRAEKRLADRSETEPSLGTVRDPLRIQHELQVYQVELELQNAELRRTSDLALRREGPAPVTVRVETVAAPSEQECRVALIDITERKLAEELDLLKTLNAVLEERVAERTAALKGTIADLRDEIIKRGKAEEHSRRLNRLYAVLSETNKAILRTGDRDTLFKECCQIAVGQGNFKLAWVGLLDEESGEVHAVAADGATGYLDGVKITANEEPSGLGPFGRTVRDGTHYVCNDFQGSPHTLPWHERGRLYGFRAAASVALKQQGRVIGALTLYSDEENFFDPSQVSLLQQAGEDISFALDNMLRENRRQEAERALREETAERLRAMEALGEKEQLLIQQSRLAAMGEMIGNIAHQWRQPLNLLAIIAQKLLLFYDHDKFDRSFLAEHVDKEMELIRNMSKTIDDFTNYFKPADQKTEFYLRDTITDVLSLLNGGLQHTGICVEIVAKDEIGIHGYRNEFAQVLLNILINAKDVLTEREVVAPKVTIATSRAGGLAVVTIADNGGGIPEDFIGKIFDPYFTTKGPQQGTGIGLYMAKIILEKNMGGRLTARNIAGGAEFRIELLI